MKATGRLLARSLLCRPELASARDHPYRATGDGFVDLVVFSHLPWDYVWQRPQHLLSRAARRHRVLFIEEAEGSSDLDDRTLNLALRPAAENLTIATPYVRPHLSRAAQEPMLAAAIADLVAGWRRGRVAVWHYSVMAEPLSRDLDADVTVFDCMDELSLFKDAPRVLGEREAALLDRADVVFTGGYALYEAKRGRHRNVHPFPSSVDLAHFARTRSMPPEPDALHGIGRPRFVYAGVLDERIDLSLVAALAESNLGEVVLVGPVAKIDPNSIPRHRRIHRLGLQPYAGLPALFAHANVGLMPFALNDATRFISPTKTLEYLAARLPIVATPVPDVVRCYSGLDAVRLASSADAFIAACRKALEVPGSGPEVEALLERTSWDATWVAMERLVLEAATDGGLAA